MLKRFLANRRPHNIIVCNDWGVVLRVTTFPNRRAAERMLAPDSAFFTYRVQPATYVPVLGSCL